MSNGIGPARVAWNRGTQKRVAVTSTILSQLKGIKMLGMTDWVLRTVQGFRKDDIHLSRLFRWKIVLVNMIGKPCHQTKSASLLDTYATYSHCSLPCWTYGGDHCSSILDQR